MTEPNIILAGFMGTGKTTAGKAVAGLLGRPFVDLDDVIAARAGKSIPEIFDQDGEAAFRDLEAAVCQEYGRAAGHVVAVGGGAVLDEANRQALAAGGCLICLEADPDVIVQRLAGQNGRPLLAGPDRRQRVAALLAQRAGAYDALPHHLNTSRLSVAAAAERILGIAAGLPEGGHRLIVHDAEGYDILLADGLLQQAGARLAAAGLRPGRCAVITNPVVGGHYAAALLAALGEAGFKPALYEIPDGEAHKTLATVNTVYERFAAEGVGRDEPVIALGGGVTGDLAGFVAATWLRGVPFVQIPTSLLAMVDASVGGKTGVDLPAGKNLVGAFKQPRLVLMDPALLSTLPGAEFRAGLAEVVKSSLVAAPALFEQLAAGNPGSLTAMLADTVRVKVRIVERDPYEMGERAWLNLGHTFGHALERLSGFTLRHGEAVALGLIAAAHMSHCLGYCARDLPLRVRSVCERLGLPTQYDFAPEAALPLMGADKKRVQRRLRFVLLRGIGHPEVVDNPPEEAIIEALKAIGASERSEQP